MGLLRRSTRSRPVSRFATGACCNAPVEAPGEGTQVHISQYANRRMSQRGVSRRLVYFTLRGGCVEGTETVITPYNVRTRMRRHSGGLRHV
jgi:hypothetical protein